MHSADIRRLDYFAAHALVGYMIWHGDAEPTLPDPEVAAHHAFEFAHAMLEESLDWEGEEPVDADD